MDEIYYIHQILQDKNSMPVISVIGSEKHLPLFDANTLPEDFNQLEFEIKDWREGFDFYFLHEAVLVFNQKVYDSELFTSFEFAGEIIPLKVTNTDTSIYLANILNCKPYLDYKNSEFGANVVKDEKIIDIVKFKANRISCDASLFKLPENASQAIYCSSYADEHDFHRDYQNENFKGLNFKLLAKYTLVEIDDNWVLEEIF